MDSSLYRWINRLADRTGWVEGAVRRHDAVVTSNPTHIRKIADSTRAHLTIETV